MSYKIFFPARHGLGNVLEAFFVLDHGRIALARARELMKEGIVTECAAIYEQFMNESIAELFSSLSFPVTPIPTNSFHGVPVAGENIFPHFINGYHNAFHLPEELKIERQWAFEPPPTSPVEGVPEKFVLFTGFAGEADRFVNDATVLETIRSVTRIPIVSIGKPVSRNGGIASHLKGDIDLIGRTTVPQALWLMSKCSFVVSSLSYLRTANFLFGKRVLEVTQNPSHGTTHRTEWEYRTGQYGIKPGMNFWFKWPAERETFAQAIRDLKPYVGVTE